jgi:hypothetical protein
VATRNGIGCDWGAAGTSRREGPKSKAEPTSVLPIPIRPESRPAATAPASQPTFPMANTTPMACADSSSSLTAYTRKIENASVLKKFDTATVIAIGLQKRWPSR